MKLFYTISVAHLAKKINVKKGRFLIKRFSDNEIYVRILENVKNKKVWVIGNTNPPSQNLVELIFLLDALKRNGAKINLIIPYFGYARQDRIVVKGEALSAEDVADVVNKFKPENVFVIHPHSSLLQKYIKHKAIIPLQLYSDIAKKHDSIIAPDKGALEVAKRLGKLTKKPVVAMQKVRPSHEKVIVTKVSGKAKGNVIFIDDIIATGKTIIEASKKLKDVKEISIIATHGVLSGNADKNLRNKKIRLVYVTNTIVQKRHPKVKVLDISKFIERLIKNSNT
jgi:ribose-phosphate pyrophosphokinase